MIRTQYNYFTFPKPKENKKKVTQKEPPKMYNPYLTIQGLDTSIFSMLENGLTQEGETKKGTYTENMLVNAFTDPLDFETEFEKDYQRQFFDDLHEVDRIDENQKAAVQPSDKSSTTERTNVANDETERSGVES